MRAVIVVPSVTDFYFTPHRASSLGARAVLARRPEVVLVSCFAWAYAEESRNLIDCIKKTDPSVTLIAGGPGVSVLPDYFISADHILCGEAETQLPEILDSPSPRRVLPFDPDRTAETFTVPWGVARGGRITQINQQRTFEKRRFEELLGIAASKNIRTISYFIAGLPGDSRKNLIEKHPLPHHPTHGDRDYRHEETNIIYSTAYIFLEALCVINGFYYFYSVLLWHFPPSQRRTIHPLVLSMKTPAWWPGWP